MENDFKNGIIKYLNKLIIVMVILLICGAITYLYTLEWVAKLEKNVKTLQHELDYMKYRIDELEKNH